MALRIRMLKCHARLMSSLVPEVSEVQNKKIVHYDPKNRPTPSLDDRLLQRIKNQEIRPHVGRLKVVNPPNEVTEAFHIIVDREQSHLKHQFHDYMAKGEKLYRFLNERSLTFDGAYGKYYMEEIQKRCLDKYGNLDPDEEDVKSTIDQLTKFNRLVEEEKRKRQGRWKSVQYDKDAALGYFIGKKAAFDYACVKIILSEIKAREKKSFAPKSLLDFGSGVGSVSWAVEEVFGRMFETMYVDESRDMNDFSRMILNKSIEENDLPQGVYYRLQLPRDAATKYDLVVSAFSLLDLRSENERLAYVDTLWRRVEKNGFLVLVENGSHSGFRVISEARNLIVKSFDDEETVGHVFAPCSHDLACPKLEEYKSPCFFELRFRNFPFRWLTPAEQDTIYHGRCSYLVVKKGQSDYQRWPRVMEPPIISKGKAICRLCTGKGKLQEIIVTKSSKELLTYCKTLTCGKLAKLHLHEKEQLK